jgi:hypothetical protein
MLHWMRSSVVPAASSRPSVRPQPRRIRAPSLLQWFKDEAPEVTRFSEKKPTEISHQVHGMEVEAAFAPPSHAWSSGATHACLPAHTTCLACSDDGAAVVLSRGPPLHLKDDAPVVPLDPPSIIPPGARPLAAPPPVASPAESLSVAASPRPRSTSPFSRDRYFVSRAFIDQPASKLVVQRVSDHNISKFSMSTTASIDHRQDHASTFLGVDSSHGYG